MSSIVLTRIVFLNSILPFCCSTVKELYVMRRVHSSWLENVMDFMDDHWCLVASEDELIKSLALKDEILYRKIVKSKRFDFNDHFFSCLVTPRRDVFSQRAIVVTILKTRRYDALQLYIDEGIIKKTFQTQELAFQHGDETAVRMLLGDDIHKLRGSAWFYRTIEYDNTQLFSFFLRLGASIFDMLNHRAPLIKEFLNRTDRHGREITAILLKCQAEHDGTLECYRSAFNMLEFMESFGNGGLSEAIIPTYEAILRVDGVVDALTLKDINVSGKHVLKMLDTHDCKLLKRDNVVNFLNSRVADDNADYPRFIDDAFHFMLEKGFLTHKVLDQIHHTYAGDYYVKKMRLVLDGKP